MKTTHVLIQPFSPGDQAAFVSLNLAWLTGYGLLEPADEQQLYDPQTHVFDHGGEIFVARVGAAVVGCCAAIPHPDGTIEIAKLAVDHAARGRGLGRRLVEAGLHFGQARHYTKAVLTSNHRLRAALRLYESIGFRYGPVPSGLPYATVDVYMELDLAAWEHVARST